jgi:3-(3-hydroxy-phenyl)propionate hydroxylase
MEMFAAWGVIDEILERGKRSDRLQYWERESRQLIAELPYSLIAEDTAYPFRLQCPQNIITRVLKAALDDLPHARVHMEHCALGHTELADGVELTVATLDGERRVRGSYLVGCDGAHSAVRKGLGLKLHGTTYTDRFLLIGTDLRFDDTFRGIGPVAYIYDPSEWAIVMELPELTRTVFRLGPTEDADTALDETAIRMRMAGLIDGPAEFELKLASVYSVHQRIAESFRVGRVLLAGDAAHLNNPTGGMGMNSGIHDACTLVDALSRVLAGEPDRLLDHYAALRRRVAQDLVQAAADHNYRDLVLADWNARKRRNQRMEAVAADPDMARAYLRRAAMLDAPGPSA